MSGESFWGVLQTEARREPFVKMLLTLDGIETFMPLIRVRHVLARYRTALLFPSYLFCRISYDDWHGVNWVPRVIRLIRDGDRPARMPPGVIEALQKRARGGYVHLPPRVVIRHGDAVRILHGHFVGQTGLFAGQSTHERQKVLLDLLGQKVEVEMPQGYVERLDVASKSGFQ